MAYTYGTTKITKNNYDVFIRPHAITGTGSWPSEPAAIATFVLVASGAQGDINDYIMVAYDYDLAIPVDTCWLMVGKGNEKPTMKNTSGQTLNLNTGDEMNISENTEVSFEDLEVTAGNYTVLREMSNDANVDVLFVDKDNLDNGGFGAADVKLSVFLEVTGNDFNKVVLSGKKESDMSTNVLLPITVSAT
jgi:hypothetical protein